jgi:parvulin-like peptidyl-prolyl isomerase
MEVLAEGIGADVTDADLQAWLDANTARYSHPARYDLRQIFFSTERGANLQRDVAAALDELERSPDADWSALGDATLLPAALSGTTEGDIAAQFGEAYSAQLSTLPTGRWLGPVPSAYGAHIVRVDRRDERRPAALSDVRDEVEREVRNARSEAASQALYERLRGRYAVRKEVPSTWFDEALAEGSR